LWNTLGASSVIIHRASRHDEPQPEDSDTEMASPIDPVEPDPDPLVSGPATAPCTLLLAHGAGQGPESPFMQAFADRLGEAGLRVVRFRFPYMRAADGKRRPPDREPRLRAAWLSEIARQEVPPSRLLIGGKSLGGRIASLIADDAGVAGLVCLGYPFHPPGKPERPRIDHLLSLRTPTLICQGERDPFGHRAEVQEYALSEQIAFEWIGDGEHSFKPRKASGRDWEQNLDAAATAIKRFVRGRCGTD
jgi:hypothetical protein